MSLTLREQLTKRHAALKSARAPWEVVWRDICEQVLPYRAIWYGGERNDGRKLDQKIINSTPVQAVETAAAGMMSNITSPSRDWHRETIPDSDLAEYGPVKMWLDDVRRALNKALSRSNFYHSLANASYPDLNGIGTAPLFQEVRGDRLVFTPLAIGEYCLDIDSEGNVDTCFLERSLSVKQIVEKFGKRNLRAELATAWDRGDYCTTHPICRAVYPNDEYQHGVGGPSGMTWRSVWWDPTDGRADTVLQVGGYRGNPVLAPRWRVRPGDAYGRGPGWTARGDCRQLQHYEKEKIRITDKIADPPMHAHGVKRASLLPGDVTYGDNSASKYEPAYIPSHAALNAIQETVHEFEARIERAFNVDLWRQLLDDERPGVTATEIDARRRDRMTLLGPLLESLNNTLLDPVVTRTFDQLEELGLIPPPPEELFGVDLQIEFISAAHQMQQETGLYALRTIADETGRLSAFSPGAAGKLDTDAYLEEVLRITGARPDVLVSKEKREEEMREQAKIEEAKQAGEAAMQATAGARNLGVRSPGDIKDLGAALSPAAAALGGVVE